MNFDEYQKAILEFKTYEGFWDVIYPTLELANESGELAGKIKKWIRGDYKDLDRDAIRDELGDILFPMAMLATALRIDLSSVATRNIEKLTDRKRRGKLQGSGDNR